MEFNFVSNIKNCADLIRNNSEFIRLLYYSHIPVIIISLLIGIFIFLKDRKNILSKILILLTIAFSLWSILDLLIWIKANNGTLNIFAWSLLGILDALFFILSLYFVYVFIGKKDISFKKKILFGLLLLPIIIMTPTTLNLSGFSIAECESIENSIFLNYLFALEIGVSIWIIILIIQQYIRADKEFRKQILLLGTGIVLFLLSFFSTGYIADLTENFNYEFYGLFGMVIFMAFLGYLIVKFKAFNIKMLAAQALVVSLIILIGSMFAFVETATSRILVGVTLALSAGMGWLLVKSVKLEVQRKEELQYMSDKLAVANDQLRKLDNAKSEFISIASHQLRTPLTAVKGFISLILEGAYGTVENKIRDALNKVYVSNERLIQLVENLLNVSRIESGRLEFKFEKAKIESIIRELGDSFILVTRAKGLYLDIKLPATPLPEIEMDGPKIREVLSNLVDNAIKYTNRGGITVRAELVTGGAEQKTVGTGYPPILAPGIRIIGEEPPENSEIPDTRYQIPDTIRITISDTGIGIPEKELPFLFSRFSRGKDTSRLHVGGTGLGLYVGKNMVEAHHGRIWAESDGLNKGSRFIVELPISQDKF